MAFDDDPIGYVALPLSLLRDGIRSFMLNGMEGEPLEVPETDIRLTDEELTGPSLSFIAIMQNVTDISLSIKFNKHRDPHEI